jgi:superfamily II DNA or RNA helicase
MADPRVHVDAARGVVSLLVTGNIAMITAIRKVMGDGTYSYDPGYGFRIPISLAPKMAEAAKTWGLKPEDAKMLQEVSRITATEQREEGLAARPCRTRPWQVEVFLPVSSIDGEVAHKVVSAIDSAFTSTDPSHPPARQFFKNDRDGIIGWRLFGTLSEYYRMIISAERRGVDTGHVRAIIEDMAARQMIRQGREEGALDGFEEFDQFSAHIPEFEQRFFEGKNIPPDRRRFAPEQVRGMAFLYGNSSALLGDDVGVGKTVQTIVAAEMRRRQTGGQVLFITQPILVEQISHEIERITGLPEEQVSRDFAANVPYRVLSYNLFGTPANREIATRLLRDQARGGTIKVVVLDEVHNVKNGDPSNRDETGNLKHRDNYQTFNIQEITQHVPFVWGASATVIGNTPVDIYNELRVINHPLGKMPYGEFRRRFDPKDATMERKIMSADNLKERLIHSGTYLQRSKEQIRPDMPALHIDDVEVDLGNLQLPDNATRQREVVALAKVPHTVEMMMQVIRRGGKTAAFTSFKAPLSAIYLSLQQMMQDEGIVGRVAKIEGGQPDRKTVIRDFRNPASDYRAIVISTPAGGTGLDFPNILTDVFVNDFDWSVAKDAQSLGRFHRINSQEPVNVTYVVGSGADAENYRRLQVKKQIADEIRRLDQAEVDLLHSGIDGTDARVKNLRAERLQLHGELDRLDQVP